MAAREFLFTSESVTEGHPDKVADQISDAVLDAILARGSRRRASPARRWSRPGLVVVAGEITTETLGRHPRARARDDRGDRLHALRVGFDAHTCGVIIAIDKQSPDIAQGVDDRREQHDPGDDDR